MAEKITKYERKAQYGNAAQNSARADNLHGRKTPTFVGFERPVYETDGSCAKKPAQSPPIPRWQRFANEEPPPPLRNGMKLHVRFESVREGVAHVIEGVAEVLKSMWVFNGHLFHIKVNGIVLARFMKWNELLEAALAFWRIPRGLSKANGEAAAKHTLPVHLLPAPQNNIVALLPARCA